MECGKCHRTGFDEDQLATHQAEPCVALTGRPLREHLQFDQEGPLQGRDRLPCVNGTGRWTEEFDADSLRQRIADLEEIVRTFQASVVAAQAEAVAASAIPPAKAAGKGVG